MNAACTPANQPAWINVCSLHDLVEHAGVCALIDAQQVAIFYLPGQHPAVHAIDNFCPLAEANVLSRGLVGDLKGEPVVASPLYKEHYSLRTGQCLEKPAQVRVWAVALQDDQVFVQRPAAAV